MPVAPEVEVSKRVPPTDAGQHRVQGLCAMSNLATVTIEKLAYTLEEATALGLPCRSRLYELAGTGKLRLVKDGKRTLILAEEVRRYIASLPSAKVGRTA